QRERRRLAGAGLGDADEIAPRAHQRNGIDLDRGGCCVVLLRNRAGNRFSKAEVSKGGQGKHFRGWRAPASLPPISDTRVCSKTSRVFWAVGEKANASNGGPKTGVEFVHAARKRPKTHRANDSRGVIWHAAVLVSRHTSRIGRGGGHARHPVRLQM